MMIRSTGDTLAVTPPLIISDAQIDELIDKLRKTILSVA
jgi:beta-alanine--pyruvate transaminase